MEKAIKKPWTTFFKVKGIKPGLIDHPKTGKIDLSKETVPFKKVKALYDEGCVYIELTEEGKKLYSEGVKTPATKADSKK